MNHPSKEPLAFVCSHVFNRTRPVLLVSRADGDWQFLCGGEHDPDDVPKVVGMNHLIDADPSLKDVRELAAEWEAERDSPAGCWSRRKLQE